MAVFARCASAMAAMDVSPVDDEAEAALRDLLELTLARVGTVPAADRPLLSAAVRVLIDLGVQGWRTSVRGHVVQVGSPPAIPSSVDAAKARVRRQELIKRDEQLRQPSVRRFVQEMEQPRLHRERLVSIFSLMRDGRELADALRVAARASAEDRLKALPTIVDPYIQFVSDEGRCPQTGLRLQDIWRYFRHTWSNQYSSTPGRTIAMLIRDRAAPMHPVIGIAAIGSPVVQIRQRDHWIGWHPTSFMARAIEEPNPRFGTWLKQVVSEALNEIHTEDLVVDGLLNFGELRHPTNDALLRLRAFGAEERRLHHRYARATDYKRNATGVGDNSRWIARALTHLFRSRRALALADLLHARQVIDRFLGFPPTSADVAALLADREGRAVVARTLRKAKADRVGIAMADITVCGAIAPYNALLGGKLVAMLVASPEVVEAYRQRYASAESEIASSMAGRAIVRPADLVFLGTTSLYGAGSSQYNRVRVPAGRLGGREDEEIRYIELGQSESFGTSQFSSATVAALVDIVQQSKRGQRVNSIFGEGVSPKLRKVREGLELLNFPAERLLRHGRPRVVYGVPLARNTREYLLGVSRVADYSFSVWGAEASAEIAEWWRERWLSRRLENDRVLDQVAGHTLVRPIRHGARVTLPTTASTPPFPDNLTGQQG
ncbi:MAG: DUF4338 domain-containing protein [Dehalococcoidia bacterium]|nr:DUF4338 domain-containing protein [Dehalococcoidia bacterium]